MHFLWIFVSHAKMEQSSGGEESLTWCDCQMTNFWWLIEKWNYLCDIVRDYSFHSYTHTHTFLSLPLYLSEHTWTQQKGNKYKNIEMKSQSNADAPWFHLWALVCAKEMDARTLIFTMSEPWKEEWQASHQWRLITTVCVHVLFPPRLHNHIRMSDKACLILPFSSQWKQLAHTVNVSVCVYIQ